MTPMPPSYEHPGAPPARPELPEGAPAPPEPPQDEPPRLGVPIWAPLVAVVVGLGTFIVLQLLIAIGYELAGGDTEAMIEDDGWAIAFTFMVDALVVAASVAVVWKLRGRPSPSALGLRLTPLLPAVGWVVASYAAAWVAIAIVTAAFGAPDEQELVTDLRAEDALAVTIGFGAMICVLAPVAEEFFFRAFLFRVLAEHIPVGWAAAVGGALFGVVHLTGGADLRGVFALSVFGAMLCITYYKTSSLLPCIMAHAIFNTLSFGIAKELPWWAFLLVVAGSVMTTFAIFLLAMRLGSRPRASAPALSPS